MLGNTVLAPTQAQPCTHQNYVLEYGAVWVCVTIAHCLMGVHAIVDHNLDGHVHNMSA